MEALESLIVFCVVIWSCASLIGVVSGSLGSDRLGSKSSPSETESKLDHEDVQSSGMLDGSNDRGCDGDAGGNDGTRSDSREDRWTGDQWVLAPDSEEGQGHDQSSTGVDD